MAKKVLDDATIANMARQEKFTAEFPWLKGVVAAKSRKAGCGKCGSSNRNGVDFNQLRRVILALDKNKKRKLLTLLDTDELVVRVPNGRQIEVRTITLSKLAN